MKFAIVVNGSPSSSQAAATALRFTEAALHQGVDVLRVFFYGESVLTANRLTHPPQDETNLTQRWQQLASDHDVELIVCIAAAVRRGVMDEREAKRYEHTADNLADGFELSGLGQLVDASIGADRVITFGGRA
ncbi:sulfurtransferase complex subunit TusD [Motiliproteus coralliicola]|uniref:Sulfurtransferase complex subunit TusD n=1 Tax=Motiliproteus coralliicola TaxID=2283196 RepID=A0A369WVX8_9GAMM|nr:sulfurtransferase complex subunit TusD [Motiliproteus coralliicola]RDE24704.1 sulfurtransferase complex subunit TusD [Motiliproteus coralliicola]